MWALVENRTVRRLRPKQASYLGLPELPTTTIGSFPQTAEIRKSRSQYAKGTIDRAVYEAAMRSSIDEIIAFQDNIGIDVLVHGSPSETTWSSTSAMR